MTRNELKGCLHFFCYYKYEPKWGQSTEADQDNFRICWMHSWRTHCRTATATPFPTKSEGRKSSLLWNHIYKSTVLWPASSWKITLGVKELFFIHWTGKSVRDVLFFLFWRKPLLTRLNFILQNGVSLGWNEISNCCLTAQPTRAGRGLWKANTFLCAVPEKISKKPLPPVV